MKQSLCLGLLVHQSSPLSGKISSVDLEFCTPYLLTMVCNSPASKSWIGIKNLKSGISPPLHDIPKEMVKQRLKQNNHSMLKKEVREKQKMARRMVWSSMSVSHHCSKRSQRNFVVHGSYIFRGSTTRDWCALQVIILLKNAISTPKFPLGSPV